ncbi:MAG: hypothetical protein ACKODB_00905 [Betaproteobacteria bacterium]
MKVFFTGHAARVIVIEVPPRRTVVHDIELGSAESQRNEAGAPIRFELEEFFRERPARDELRSSSLLGGFDRLKPVGGMRSGRTNVNGEGL